MRSKQDVAPHAGAWIETRNSLKMVHITRSHPTRVRGLKLVKYSVLLPTTTVAPHAGAWIETLPGVYRAKGEPGSHPTRVRGLKQTLLMSTWTTLLVSHPTRVRGLKRPHNTPYYYPTARRTPRGCVD